MNRVLPVAAILCLTLTGCASRQELPAPPSPKVTGDMVTEVASAFKRSTAAWNAGDLENFMNIYADDATLSQRDAFLVGKSAIRMLYGERLRPGIRRDVLAIERLDVAELAPEVALIRGVYRTTKDDGTMSWRGTMTVIMRRVNDQWRIIHDHSN
jgi:uncharacterized protein (TIGR02246 family)